MKKILLLLLIAPVFNLMAQQTIEKEAEEGTLSGSEVATSRSGYTGTGYVTSFDNDNDKVTMTVNAAEASSYTLTLVYASEFGDKTNDIYLNNDLISNQVFPQTNTFQSIIVGTINLIQGDNTIEVRKNWGYIDLDNLLLEKTNNSYPVGNDPVKIELENTELTGVITANTLIGFTGSGYVTGFDEEGDQLSLKIDVTETAEFKLVFGYRSEYGPKIQNLVLNDSVTKAIVFAESASFIEINTGEHTLYTGQNTLSIVKQDGYQELDYLIITKVVGSAAPIANAGPEQVVMDTDESGTESVMLNASQSTDEDDNITSYLWIDQEMDTIATGINPTVNLSVGEHSITLIIKDNSGFSDTDVTKIFVGHPTNNGHNRIGIRGGSQNVFASGFNLAWDKFANDIVALEESYFITVLDDLENAGGNAMRWWLHTNGVSSPQFDESGNVSGLSLQSISNMRKVLDLAHERGIVVSMCLWSFDMLRDQGQDVATMKRLLENPAATQKYIDNALIPILDELGDHPAVLTWEIFNEAEGMTTEFGWTPEANRTSMQYVQQFVNLVAGAIHRTTPTALVSTGSWSFKAMTDKGGNTNYYRDDRLIAAGGDPDGTLDFYQIHYYPEHFGNNLSPFHRPASYWGLDKPIVIGEFPISEIAGSPSPSLTTTEAFKAAYNYGYAGVIPWDYRGVDFGEYTPAIEGMQYLRNNYTSDIFIDIDPNFNSAPNTVGYIKNARIKLTDAGTIENYYDLKTVFSDSEDGTNLTFSVIENSRTDMVVPIIKEDGFMDLVIAEGITGKSEILIKAEDSKGASTVARFYVSIKDPLGNLALFTTIEASTDEKDDLDSDFANDGDITTRWSSEYSDDQSITVDLGEAIEINKIKLFWEVARASKYTIDISTDGENYSTLLTDDSGEGEMDEHIFDNTVARYVRMSGSTRATEFGFSLWEFEVYGPSSVTTAITAEQAPEISIFPNPSSKNINISAEGSFNIRIMDLKGNILRVDAMQDFKTIDTSDLSEGLYIIQLDNGKYQENFKIIKTR